MITSTAPFYKIPRALPTLSCMAKRPWWNPGPDNSPISAYNSPRLVLYASGFLKSPFFCSYESLREKLKSTGLFRDEICYNSQNWQVMRKKEMFEFSKKGKHSQGQR